MRLLFFGASVTEQTQNHSTGEITGFYPLLEKHYSGKLNRVAAGSCSIHDAGLVLLDDVIRKAPDVVFLEWCTALRIDRDVNVVRHICKTLASHGIAPVPLFLPRSDRDNIKTDMATDLIDTAKVLKCPYIDLTGILRDQKSQILRDVVHTNLEGAKLYAQQIMEAIKSENFIIPDKTELVQLSSLIMPSSIHISVATCRSDYLSNSGVRQLALNLQKPEVTPADSSTRFSIYADVRVGPWTGKVRTYAGESLIGEIDMYDPWCYRERQCIKQLSPILTVHPGLNELRLVVSDQLPRLTGVPIQFRTAFSPFKPCLKVRGRIYLIASSPGLHLEVVES